LGYVRKMPQKNRVAEGARPRAESVRVRCPQRRNGKRKRSLHQRLDSKFHKKFVLSSRKVVPRHREMPGSVYMLLEPVKPPRLSCGAVARVRGPRGNRCPANLLGEISAFFNACLLFCGNGVSLRRTVGTDSTAWASFRGTKFSSPRPAHSLPPLPVGDGRQARGPASRRPKTAAFSLPTLPVRFRRQLRLTLAGPNPATPPCCRLVIQLLGPAPDPALREKPIPRADVQVFEERTKQPAGAY
jgi:hypothetical protein